MSLLKRIAGKNNSQIMGAGQPEGPLKVAPVRPTLVRRVDPFVKLKSKIHEKLVGRGAGLANGADEPGKRRNLSAN